MSDVDCAEEDTDSVLHRLGTRAWMVVGIAIIVAMTYVSLAVFSGIVVPTIVAVVIAMLFEPFVNSLARYMPRPIAATLVLIGLIGIAVLTVAVAVIGIIDQAPQIGHQISAGLDVLSDWFDDLGIDLSDGSDPVGGFGALVSGSAAGLASYATTVFSSAAAFIAGSLISIFVLYYLLIDARGVSRWVGAHLGLPADLGMVIVDDATRLNQQYFYALTISGFLTGVIIGFAMWALGLPLAFTIGTVTFLTSYVPFLGAIFSGSFAFLVALGSGDFTLAFIVLIMVLVVQNIVQPMVQAKLNQDRLNLHPVATFASTIVGAVLAGVLGAALSAPALATIISVNKRINDYRHRDSAAVEDRLTDTTEAS